MSDYTQKEAVFIESLGEDVELVLEFDLQPAERGSRSEGLQWEPDYPPSVDLTSATDADGKEYIDLIDEDTRSKLEVKALENAEQEAKEDFVEPDPYYD